MTFGLCLTLSFGLFYWMLWRLGRKYQINTAFFTVNLLSFFLVTFFVSRLAHVLLYLGLPTNLAFSPEVLVLEFSSCLIFTLVSEGLFSDFLVHFYLFSERDDADRDDALDITVIAWLFGAILAYLGAFLGGQTSGIRSESFFSVDYINNPILAEFPRFPLALVYFISIIFIFSLTYIVKKLRPERGFAAGVQAHFSGVLCGL